MIANQNGGDGYPGLYNEKSEYDWIMSAAARDNRAKYREGAWDFLYERVSACQKRNDTYFDISDSGMALFLLTGDDKSSPSKLQRFMCEE